MSSNPKRFAFSIRNQLVETIGTFIGPNCIHCGEMIDVRNHHRNGMLHTSPAQGWIHETCRRECEQGRAA